MRVHVFATGHSVWTIGPLQFVPDVPQAAILGHPCGAEWRYWMTLHLDDAFFDCDRAQIQSALEDGRSVVSRRYSMPLGTEIHGDGADRSEDLRARH